jgi:formylglycine-generating enzyme required for sulfatase activity
MVCAPTEDTLVCELTSPVVTPQAETCDDEDDDCDGDVDEGAPDEMVSVVDGTVTYYVYKYEASRPDASATGFGNAQHRSCSKPGVYPWRNVTKVEAEAACSAAGKRLCTEAEWQRACGGATGLAFPYGNTYAPLACNGRDVDLDCAAPDSDAVATTSRSFTCPQGAASQCVSPSGAIDMSGNLREWTSTPVGANAFRVRGGGYDNIEQGLRCDFAFIAFEPDTVFPNLGFRCCSDTP